MAEPKTPRKGPNAEELLRRWEADKRRSLAFLPLAEEYRRQESIDAALSVLKEGLKLHPNSQPARVSLARCLMAKGQHAAAQAELERVRAKVPDNLLAGRLLAEVFEARGEKRRALDVALGLVPFGPDDPEVRELVERLEAAVLGKVRLGTATAGAEGDTNEFLTGEFDLTDGGAPRPAGRAMLGDMEEASGDDLEVAAALAAEMGKVETPPPVVAVSGVVLDPSDPDASGLDASEDDVPATAIPAPRPPDGPSPADLLGPAPAGTAAGGEEDEFTSLTLAELYESQEAPTEALAIYERLLGARPGDPALQRSVERCRRKLAGPTAADATPAPPAAAKRPRWAPVRKDASVDAPFGTPTPAQADEPVAPVEPVLAPRGRAAAPRGAAVPAPRRADGALALPPAALVALRGELTRWLQAARAVRQ